MLGSWLAAVSGNLVRGLMTRMRQDDIGLLVAFGGFVGSCAPARSATTPASNQTPRPTGTKALFTARGLCFVREVTNA